MSHDLDQDLKQLFDRARRHEDPRDADRLAVQRALVARLGTGVAAGGAATLSAGTVAAQGSASAGLGAVVAGKTTLLAGAALWLLIGATVGTGVSLATVSAPTPAPASIASTVTKPQRAIAGGFAPRRHDPAPGDSRIGTASFAAKAPPLGSKPRSAVNRAPGPEKVVENDSTLHEETRGLALVQQALRDERPDDALALLTAQERSFPGGTLQAERAAARVLALCSARRVPAARAAAELFLRSYPDSPLADRVSGSCAK